MVCLLFGLIGNANAIPIIGAPTADGDTTPVGTVMDDKIEFFIPLGGSSGVYGAGGYGMSSDSAFAQINGPTMDMYLLFNVPVGNLGHTLTLAFTDLDLAPHNDPNGFFERLTINGAYGLPNGTFESYTDPILAPYVTSANDAGSILTYTGLNIGPGNSWVHLGFEAYSVGLSSGEWRNTAEYMTATLDANPVPEPATLLLLGTGLIGIAGFSKKKFRKS